MKKQMQIIPHILAFIILGAFYAKNNMAFITEPSLFIIYALCLLLCPIIALCKLSAFCKSAFYTIGLICLCGLIFICNALFGALSAIIVLSVSALIFGTLLVSHDLPESTKETVHLEKRGLTYNHARRIILFRQSLAFFFYRSGPIASLIGAYLLFIHAPNATDSILSMAILVTVISFIGKLLYGMLGSPVPFNKTAKLGKGRYITICLLAFFMLFISCYIYIGAFHSSPDPALKSALFVCRNILTASYIGTLAAVIGVLFGIILSRMGGRFFKTVFAGPKMIPTVFFSALLYALIKIILPYAEIVSVCVPLFIFGIYSALEYKIQLVPFKELPLLDRKATLIKPLFVVPLLGTLPIFMTEAFFASVYINLAADNNLNSFSSLSGITSSVILAFLLINLYLICILTKEVRRNG